MTRQAKTACGRCGARFGHPDHLALHRARDHDIALSSKEQAAFEQAKSREEAWMVGFRSHVAGALAASVVVLTYIALVLSSYILRANPVFVALPAPGIVLFAGLTYWLVFHHRRKVEQRSKEEASDAEGATSSSTPRTK